MGGRRRWGVVGLAACVLLGGGCGAERVDPPDPAVPDDAPVVAAASEDPADDAQLDALRLPEELPGLSVPPSADDDVARLARLSALVAAVRDELGDDVGVCRVEAGYALAISVPTGESVVEWRLGVSDGADVLVQAQAPVLPACERLFPLADVRADVPARLAEGARRRAPGAALTSATLAVDPDRGLSWHLGFTRGGTSAGVIADADGLVLAVTP